MRLPALVLLLATAACVTTTLPPPDIPVVRGWPAPPVAPPPPADTAEAVPRDEPPARARTGLRDIRVALQVAREGTIVLAAEGAARVLDDRERLVVGGSALGPLTVEGTTDRLRVVDGRGRATGWQRGFLTLLPDGDAIVRVGARRVRGAVRVVATDSGLLVVNVLPVEQYLRGVVPQEIGGGRTAAERAAVEAQAVAARSFTYQRLAAQERGAGRSAWYDVLATTADQVYGGVAAERPWADAAVRATAGLVLTVGGRPADAPYHAACGGETAHPDEVWRGPTASWLRRVDDRIPGTRDRYWCDIAPRFAWTRTLEGGELAAGLDRYLGAYARVPAGGVGRVRGVEILGRTGSGRAARVAFDTDAGRFEVRGNDARWVLRAPGAEPLNSAYFSVETERGAAGVRRVVLRGNGFGHGVGLCQWGAIARARAGQDVRTILRAYYPGAEVGSID